MIAMLAQRTPRDRPLGPPLRRSKLFFSASVRWRASYEAPQCTLVQEWRAYLDFLYLREGRRPDTLRLHTRLRCIRLSG